MGGKTSHASQCSKSCALTTVIDLILEIESFEQQRVIIKGLLHSYHLKKHMVIIEIDQLLINCEMYEHRCLENIKKL